MGFRFSTNKPSDELTAAEHISKQLGKLKYFQNEKEFDCFFVIEPRLRNKRVKSSDILMICEFTEEKKIDFKNPIKWSYVTKDGKELNDDIKSTKLKNFITCVEVKLSSADDVRFNDANNLEVYYKHQDYWSNVTMQSRNQLFATREAIQKKGSYPPNIQSIIYLHNIKREQFENIHGSDFPIEIKLNDDSIGFLQSICHQLIQFKKPESILNKVPKIFSSLNKDFNYYKKSEWVQSNPKPSKFDMKRANAIAKKVEPEHYEDLGKRMIEYRGVGGTGKTIKLLQIAHQTYKEEQKNILFLTYNWALIIGLQLTMEHMSIPNAVGERPGIQVDSCNSFFWRILRNLEFLSDKDGKTIDDNPEKYNDIYESALKECADFLKSFDEDRDSLKKYLRQNSHHDLSTFSDYVLVDEGQDWIPEEQYILECIFGSNNILVACGTGQETRGLPTVWGKNLSKSNKRADKTEKRFHTLTKAMRMRGNLGAFVKTFAELTLTDDMYKKLVPNTDALEGEIFIIEGDYFKQKELRNYLQEKRVNEVGDVYALDLLHIVPPKMNVSDFNHGLDEDLIWDGIDKLKRRKVPTSEKMVRWINYRSCRGLEGWITFNHYLDEYWDFEFNTQKIDVAQGSLFENATDEQKRKEAFRWILIALTRPIDSTVITLRDKDSELGKILQEVKSAHPSFVNWYS